MPERSSKDDERRIEAYFDSLKQDGGPFDRQSSSLYAPLSSEQFRDTPYELRFKRKSSPMIQVADLYLWPLAMAGYDEGNRAYDALKAAGRLMENQLPEDKWPERGTKYSCFDLVWQDRKSRG
jgi:hypothetical protein